MSKSKSKVVKPGEFFWKCREGGMILKGEDAHQAAIFHHLSETYPGLPVYGNAGASALSAGFSSPQQAGESNEAYAVRKRSQGAQIQKIRKMASMGAHKAWPDIAIVSRSSVEFARTTGAARQYISLYIELKDEDRPIYKRSGDLCKDERMGQQAAQLMELNRHGAFACFANGSQQAIMLIDWYLTGVRPDGLIIWPIELTTIDRHGDEVSGVVHRLKTAESCM